MGLVQKLVGWVSGNGAEVDSNHQLLVGLPNVASQTGKIRMMGENDDGSITGNVGLMSPEVDIDYRLRVANDVMMDDEHFNYTAQNTGKHTTLAAATNLVPSWTAGAYNTNPTGVLTAASGATLQTYGFFPVISTGVLSCDMEIAFTNQPTANTVIDFGMFIGAATNPFAPTDGAYFRLNSAGLQGVANYNGNETVTSIFPATNGTGTWTYTNNRKYQFIIYITLREIVFWVGDGTETGALKLGSIPCPIGQGTPVLSTALPVRIRHAIAGGAAGVALSAMLSRYSVRIGGVSQTDTMALFSSRSLGTYQGLSGGTMGSLMYGTVTTGSIVPTAAAVATNTTAALGSGLGGLFRETATLAAGTDGIIMSYQVPAGTAAVQGRRLKITGISISSYVQTVIVGGPIVIRYYLAFGHTTVSLQQAESAFAKAPRRMALPFLQVVTAAQAVSTLVSQNVITYTLNNPVYVNPGEFVALVAAKIGTAITSGVLDHNVTIDYSWE